MKKIFAIMFLIFVPFVSGCSISIDFDGAMIERFTDKIAYLYANCWSDIEWLQEVMTPETIKTMDQTCVASIKAITKIKSKIQKLKNMVGESEILNQILAKVDEIINSLQDSKNQIINMNDYNDMDMSMILNKIDGDKLIESLESLSEKYNNQ